MLLKRERGKQIAVYAGSFDPFTTGHLAILKQASEIFDQVFLLFASNRSKKLEFDRSVMMREVENDLRDLGLLGPDGNVWTDKTDGLIADYCVGLSIHYLVRGLRNTTDFMYEEEIAKFNRKIEPDIKTIYLRAEDDAISSSMVKEMLYFNKSIQDYVPPHVHDYIINVKAGLRYGS